MPLPTYQDSMLRQQRRHEEIALKAWLKAKDAGFPLGRDVEFWLEAEAEVDEARRTLFQKVLPMVGLE